MRATKRGLTLVEVSVVVTIIGILAVIAVVAYRKKIAAARTTEATNMINNIRTGQEAHKAESGFYANVSQNINSFYPATAPGAKATQWGAPCTNCVAGDPNAWEKIGVHADGPVIFGYATTAGTGASAVAGHIPTGVEPEISAAVNSMSSAIGTTTPFFVALAEADYDANGVKCHVLGLSATNHLVVTNDGE